MASMNEILRNAFSRVTTGDFVQRQNRQSLIAAYERKLEEIDRQHESNYFFHTTTTNNQVYNRGISQNFKLVSKNRIPIANLKVDNVHTGRFLLCRVISRCIKMTALATLVEDPEGDVERLGLYNWVKPSDIPAKDRMKCFTTSKFLPIGTILAIKNPYYKVASDFHTSIRSDNPSDVIVLDHNHKLISEVKWSMDLLEGKEFKDKSEQTVADKKVLSVDDFRLQGNDYFALNDFAAAVNEYSSGIKLEPNNVTLLANRAEAYLRLNQFGKALIDVEIALKYEHDHIKAAFRKGKALCGLKRYQETVITLQNLMQISTDRGDSLIKKSIEQLLKRAKMLDSENRSGKYDYTCIVDEFCEKAKIKDSDDWVYETGPRLDHADFLIDDIEIRPVKKKGRGWVAKRDIPEHTLLMVSKAFEVVYSNEAPLRHSIDLSSRTMNKSTQSEVITCIAQKLMAEPDLCRELYRLYGGPDLVPVEKLDEDLIRSVDMMRIERIVKYNSFQPMDSWHILENIGENSQLSKEVGTGLWILPSYFNHSCVDINVGREFIGDLMFLRSCQPILKGEELTLRYCNPIMSDETRFKHLKSFDINCQCRLCKLDRSEKQKIKLQRANILETYENSIKPRAAAITSHVDPSLIKELTDIIVELCDLRKEHPDLEFQSIELKTTLATVYAKSGNTRQSLSVMQEIYNLLKTNRISQFTIDTAFKISTLYFELGQVKEAKKWIDVALKELVEPLRGKFEDEETIWKEEEALHLAEKLAPNMISFAKTLGPM